MVGIAAIFEVLWVIGLKHSSRWWMWLGTMAAIYVSFDLLIRSSKKLPVGTVYAVFTGMGTAGTVIMEMALFGEPLRWMKVLLILMLLTGVVGLKIVTRVSDEKGGGA
jgi:paired small multidrug resistance pump